MAEQALIQFRADKKLKEEVSTIYESLGLDLPTAFRMFLIRSKAVKGLPFPAVIDEPITHEEAIEAFDSLRKEASSIPEMSLEEINNEIKEVRSERRK